MQVSGHTAAQRLGHDVPQHETVRVELAGVLLHHGHISDVLELRLGELFAVTEAAEDVARFLLAADFDEPARGFREEEDDAHEEDEGDDLEGDGEAPDEGTVAVVDKGAAETDEVGYHDLVCETFSQYLQFPRS